MGVREKWSLRYVVGFKSIQNTEDEYLWKFSVSRESVEKTENEKPKNRNADKGAHGLEVPYTQYGFLSRVVCFWSCSCSQKIRIS